MDLQFENVLGRRASVVVAGGETVTTETSTGNFKMGGALSAKLGIKDGDALTVQKAGDVYYIGKGKNGVAELDENGKEKTDDRGRTVFVEGQEPFGAIVRDINEGGAYQRFSASAAWSGLGGSADVKKVYTIGEGVDVSLEMPNGGTHTTTLYPLVFSKDEAKIVRAKKADSESADSAVADASVAQNDVAVQGAVTEVNDGFKAPDFNDEEL